MRRAGFTRCGVAATATTGMTGCCRTRLARRGITETASKAAVTLLETTIATVLLEAAVIGKTAIALLEAALLTVLGKLALATETTTLLAHAATITTAKAVVLAKAATITATAEGTLATATAMARRTRTTPEDA